MLRFTQRLQPATCSLSRLGVAANTRALLRSFKRERATDAQDSIAEKRGDWSSLIARLGFSIAMSHRPAAPRMKCDFGTLSIRVRIKSSFKCPVLPTAALT